LQGTNYPKRFASRQICASKVSQVKYPGTAAYTVDNLYQNGYISNVKGTYTTTDNIFTATGYTIAKANFIYKSKWYNADRCLLISNERSEIND
jgi:hypothetical protein